MLPIPEDTENKDVVEKEEKIDDSLFSPLVNKIMTDLNNAISAKSAITNRMVLALHNMEGQYTNEKLAEIRRDTGGSEIFIPLTNIKVRAGKAWLSEIYSDDDSIFSLTPTPVPDLPDDMEAQIAQEMTSILTQIFSSGIQLTPEAVDAIKLKLREDYRKRIKERAKELATLEEERIKDQFVQGGFYQAFSNVLYDIVLFPAAILKGPVLRKEKLFIASNRQVVETIIPTYNRVSPFDIFPSPTSTGVDSDFLIEILHLSPADLYNLIGIEGFNEEAIREVLNNYHGGYQPVSLLASNQYLNPLRLKFEGKDFTKGDIIDVIEYWGQIKGELLEEDGLAEALGISLDPLAYYSVCIWVTGGKVIKAMLNPDPLGKKPYSKASFIEVPDSFWGLSVADVLMPLQEGVNALARATINNAVLSSGPIIERNIDRISPNAPKQIYPFMMIDAHESAMTSAPAFRMEQVQPIAQQLILILDFFLKLASEICGIPSYFYGMPTASGGSGRTASGLAMLQENASRGLKDVVLNIDRNIIEPTVKRQYFFNISFLVQYPDEVPDLQIQAKGTQALASKQMQTQKLLEFLQITSNPIDTQIIGADGRRNILQDIANNLGLDVDKIFTSNPELQQVMQAMATQPAKPKEITQANDLGNSANLVANENGRAV